MFDSDLETDPAQRSFNRTIWTFWDSGEVGLSSFTRGCLKTMRNMTANNEPEKNIETDVELPVPDWKIVVVDTLTIKTYLSQIELAAFNHLRDVQKIQPATDLLRLILLKKFGGVWMDISTVMTEKMEQKLRENGVIDFDDVRKSTYPGYTPSYTTQQERERHEALLFNMEYYVNEEGSGKFEHREPVLENWYIAARKNSLFINRWLQYSL